jgi:hypothetical protein
MALSAANAVQAKTGSVTATTADIALDDPTQEGSTVTVEVTASSIPLMAAGMAGSVPDGFLFDACSILTPSRPQLVFRKPGLTGGEQSWTFSTAPTTAIWMWRVTEWDTGLEPVSPLEAVSYGTASGTGVTSLSTGTAPPGGSNTGRGGLVCLAWHHWERQSNTAQAFDWSDHTNGFTERDEQRWTVGAQESDDCWSWLFSDVAGQFSCTATVNLTTRSAIDNYAALLVVYAATTYT